MVIKLVMADHTDRMPIRRIAGRLAESNVEMSGGTIQGILDMVGASLEEPRREVEKDIRQADTLNADETSSHLHNDSVWMWVFLDPETGSTAYRVSPSRGRGVITELLGEKPGGHVACDGWGPYRICSVRRCWAHLIREVRTISRKNPEDGECKMALARLRTIYSDAKKSSRDPTRGRKRHKRMLEARMRRLINRCWDHHILGPCMRKLERALPDSFWFVLDPKIPSTNNAAERALREFVIQNRIRGCLRSEKSMSRIGTS